MAGLRARTHELEAAVEAAERAGRERADSLEALLSEVQDNLAKTEADISASAERQTGQVRLGAV